MKTSYRERDYAYGTVMLTLRTAIGLTQEGLGNHLEGLAASSVGGEIGKQAVAIPKFNISKS